MFACAIARLVLHGLCLWRGSSINCEGKNEAAILNPAKVSLRLIIIIIIIIIGIYIAPFPFIECSKALHIVIV